MSDASTSLADHPAGKANTLRPPGRRRPGANGRSPRRLRTRATGSWQAKLLDSTPTSVLVAEAGRMVERRDWRRATTLLAVAATTTDGPDRGDILRRLAVTAADGGRHRISGEAMYELQSLQPRSADTWVAIANVALARGNYQHADAAARAALAQAPDHAGAWSALAAGYAGLGWFERAQECLDRVDRTALTELQRWRIGRAVNRWAMAESRWGLVAAASALLVGVLALAVGTTVPFLARELRLRRLRTSGRAKRFEALATEAWRYERKLRLCHGVAVLASVAGFVAAVVLW